jgi:hypothetical protein
VLLWHLLNGSPFKFWLYLINLEIAGILCVTWLKICWVVSTNLTTCKCDWLRLWKLSYIGQSLINRPAIVGSVEKPFFSVGLINRTNYYLKVKVAGFSEDEELRLLIFITSYRVKFSSPIYCFFRTIVRNTYCLKLYGKPDPKKVK